MSNRKKIITAHTYETKPGFKTLQASLTQPGMAMSIRQIRDRFARGQGVDVHNGVYSDEFPVGYENLSKVDKADLALRQKQHVERIRTKLQEQEAAAEQAKRSEDIKKAAAELAAKSDAKPDDLAITT